METVNFSEVKEELLSNLKRRTLIPILGSGFTRNCPSTNGKVPSGEDYSQHMINQLLESQKFNEEDKETLIKQSFSTICDIYFELTDKDTRRKYLYDNFTNVSIQENKKSFCRWIGHISIPSTLMMALKKTVILIVSFAVIAKSKNIFSTQKNVLLKFMEMCGR